MTAPFDTSRTERRKSQVSIKTVLTVCFSLLGVGLLLYALFHAQIALALVAASAFIAVALDHAVSRFQRRFGRRLSVTLVMSLLVIVTTAVGYLLIPPMVSQGRALADRAPQLLREVRQTKVYRVLEERFGLEDKLGELREQAPELTEPVKSASISTVIGVFKLLAALVTVFFLVLFMLLFGGPIVHGALQEATPERRERYISVLGKIYRSIGGYLAGLAVICSVNAVCTILFLAIMRVPFFLPLGILSGLSSAIPLAGITIMGAAVTLIAFATQGMATGLMVGGFYILYQQFENHVLGPLVYRRTVNVNPLVVIVALLFATDLGGIMGAIIAVPVVAAVQVIIREVLAVRRERLKLPPAAPPPPDGTSGIVPPPTAESPTPSAAH